MKYYLYYLDKGEFGYADKEEKLEREEIIASGKEFTLTVITGQVDGLEGKVSELCQKYPNAKMRLNLELDKEYIYEEAEMKQLADIDKFCTDENVSLYIALDKFVGGEYQNLLIARNQIEELKQKVNSFTYEENGKQVNLSTYEKFLIVYKFVANRVYNESEDFFDERMRNWVGVLSSDKVICSGFASLLKCVCDQVFNAEELKCYEQGSDVYNEKGKELGGHANNLVVINDPKYNLNGLYYADACWDCKDEKRDNKTTFNYCLIPIQQIVEHKEYNFAFDKNLVIYQNINPYYSQGHGGGNLHPLMEDIAERYGFKTEHQLMEELNIDEVLEKMKREHKLQQEQIRENNEKLSQEIDIQVQEFFAKIGFDDLEDFKIISLYPESIAERYPEINSVLEFFDAIKSLENLNSQEVIEKAKHYKEIYNKHVEELKQINSKLLQKEKELNLGLIKELTIVESVKKHIFANTKEEESEFREDGEKGRIEKEVKEQHQQQIQECLQIGKDFIYPQPIDDKRFAKGLVALCRYGGLEEDKIKDWVRAEVEKRKEFTLNSFVEKEIIFPEEKKEDNPFEF